MKEITLTAIRREETGKEVSHRIRRGGDIPGIVYGPETESTLITVNERELSALLRREGRVNMLIDLNLEGDKNGRKVIIREMQRDPISGQLQHVDFYQVSMKRKLTISIRINLTGVPEGVKNSGGILEQVNRELDISCLPQDIPDKIEIDVSELGIGDSVHIGNIQLDKVDVLSDPKLTVATVVPPTVTKVAETEEAEEGAEEAPAEGEAAGDKVAEKKATE